MDWCVFMNTISNEWCFLLNKICISLLYRPSRGMRLGGREGGRDHGGKKGRMAFV